MIITAWAGFILLRRAAGRSLQSSKIPDVNVTETEIVSVLEHWLRKIEQEAAKFCKQKSANKTENKGGTKNEIRAFPSLGQDLAAAGSKSESWENFEDVISKFPPETEQEAGKLFKQKSTNKTENRGETKNEIRAFPSLGQDLAAARSKPESWENFEDRRPPRQTGQESQTKLTSSSSQDLMEDRTKIQFMRWSQTRVYRVTSEMRKDAMQERLEKVSKSVSRVMFQADGTQSEIDIQIKDSD